MMVSSLLRCVLIAVCKGRNFCPACIFEVIEHDRIAPMPRNLKAVARSNGMFVPWQA